MMKKTIAGAKLLLTVFTGTIDIKCHGSTAKITGIGGKERNVLGINDNVLITTTDKKIVTEFKNAGFSGKWRNKKP